MRLICKKPFLLGSAWLAAGSSFDVDERRGPDLLRSGVAVLAPESREVETEVQSMAQVETAVRRGPGRPRIER
jgi:hypothetical protein